MPRSDCDLYLYTSQPDIRVGVSMQLSRFHRQYTSPSCLDYRDALYKYCIYRHRFDRAHSHYNPSSRFRPRQSRQTIVSSTSWLPNLRTWLASKRLEYRAMTGRMLFGIASGDGAHRARQIHLMLRNPRLQRLLLRFC